MMRTTLFGWRVVIACPIDWGRSNGWRSFHFEISKHICDPPPGAWGIRGKHYCGIRFMMAVWVPFYVEQWR